MSIADEIQRLEELKANGALTEDEFAEAKRTVLAGGGSTEYVDGSGEVFGIGEGMWCTLMHLSQLTFVTGVGVILPIVMWAVSKDQSEVARLHGARMMNWLVSFVIYTAISSLLIWPLLIGIPLLLVLAVLNVVFPIIAAIKCSNGEIWSYPLCLRLFDEN